MKLSWFNTSMAHKQTQAYIHDMNNMMQCSMREREREFSDSGSNANTKMCFEVRAIALRPRLHTEGFSLYRPHRTSHTGNLH